MKTIQHIFNHQTAFLFSLGLAFLLVTSCSDKKENQETAQVEEPAPQVTAPVETPVEETQPEPEPEVKPKPIDRGTSQVNQVRSRNNPVLKTISVKYEDWDTSGDKVLSKDEFYEGFYTLWDENGDKSVDQKEFTRATKNFFANYKYDEYGKFAEWDADGNGKVSKKEYRQMMTTKMGKADGDERPDHLFVIWDLDNDDNIEKIELDNITVMLDNDDN